MREKKVGMGERVNTIRWHDDKQTFHANVRKKNKYEHYWTIERELGSMRDIAFHNCFMSTFN